MTVPVLAFEGVTHGGLRHATLRLEAGRYSLLGHEAEPLQSFVELVAGESPRRGRVLFEGAPVQSSPRARGRVATLLADERLPEAHRVVDSVAAVLRARRDPARAAELLERFDLARLAGAPLRALDARERRSVALALALTHESAVLGCFYEPFATTLPAGEVRSRLDELTARGATIIAVTSSSEDAMSVGGRWLALELGAITEVGGHAIPRLGPAPWHELRVQCSDAPRLLAALSSEAPALGVTLEAAASELRVRGEPLETIADAVARAARAAGVHVSRIEPTAPSIDALAAARAGLARGAYEAARAAAHQSGGVL